MNYLIAALITLNLWLGFKYLAWPGFLLWRGHRKDGDPYAAVPDIMIGDRGKLVAWSMMIAFLMMVWTMTLWGGVQAYGGPEEFCSALLDKP